MTGKLAEDLVRKYASKSEIETEVKVLPISVASFMSLSSLLKGLEGIEGDEYSMILVPGLARIDMQEAENKVGVSVFKGPKYAADIPLVLERLSETELSKEKPACELLREEFSRQAKKRLAEAETEAKMVSNKSGNFKIGSKESAIFGGLDFPPRIVAEILDAPLLSDEEIIDRTNRYVGQGAEIIDIGMIAGEEMAEEIPRMISILRKNFDIPLSVDTLNAEEIETSVDHGIDLIVSISGSTIEDFQGLEVPAVIVPVDPEQGYYPRDPQEKMEYLEELLDKAKNLNYGLTIADPILEPVGRGFVDSLSALYELRKRRPEVPILMGIGNVVELYDADSVGMTALLSGAASELGASFILTVEGSDKTRGAVSEISRARDMMTLADLRGSVPKDLGLDLLILKEKSRAVDPYDEKIEREAEVIRATPEDKSVYDPPYDRKGFFKIYALESEIVAVFRGRKGRKLIIKGENAEEICHEIVERGLVGDLSHAAYLGRELQKAESALKTGRGYVQGKKIF